MAKPEESANDERAEEEDVEDEEDQDESTDGDADGDEEDDEDDESDKDDSDDEAPLPKTRKELDKLVADAVRRAQNRKGAGQRHRRNGNLSDTQRRGKSDPAVESLSSTVKDLQQAETKRQFGYEHSLTPKEVDLVFRFDRNPSAKTLKNPAVKGALDGIRAHQRAKDGIPSSNGRTFQVGGKDYNELKPEEKSKNFGDRRRAILEGKKGR